MELRRAILAAAIVVVAALSVIPQEGVRAQDNPDVEQMIANAKTGADHEAIAKYYDQEAAHDRKEAKRYDRLHKYYKGLPRMTTLSMHASRMANFYKSAAEDAALMATEHREMATEMKGK